MSGRRGFLRGLLGALAAPVVAPLVALLPSPLVSFSRVNPMGWCPMSNYYSNRTIRKWMSIDAIRDRNVLLQDISNPAGPVHTKEPS